MCAKGGEREKKKTKAGSTIAGDFQLWAVSHRMCMCFEVETQGPRKPHDREENRQAAPRADSRMSVLTDDQRRAMSDALAERIKGIERGKKANGMNGGGAHEVRRVKELLGSATHCNQCLILERRLQAGSRGKDSIFKRAGHARAKAEERTQEKGRTESRSSQRAGLCESHLWCFPWPYHLFFFFFFCFFFFFSFALSRLGRIEMPAAR